MSQYVFQKIAAGRSDFATITPKQVIASRDWYREQARKVSQVNVNRFMADQPWRLTSTVNADFIGRMVMFFYDPKLKQELPYYDKFPLVFIIEMYDDGFLGINLHYLPHVFRAKLMDALWSTTNNKRYDQTTKLRINYNILKSAARFKYFKPCVKKYLSNHIRSRFMYVSPTEWDMALMLPTERFQKASTSAVWSDSTSIINGQKPARPQRMRRMRRA